MEITIFFIDFPSMPISYDSAYICKYTNAGHTHNVYGKDTICYVCNDLLFSDVKITHNGAYKWIVDSPKLV